MPPSIQGIIFDLDGTLIDSRQDLANAVNHTLCKLGQEVLPVDRISSYVGDGVKNLLTHCLSHSGRTDLVEEGIAIFKDHYGKHLLDNTCLYPGVREILDMLKSKKMAVVTNKPEAFTVQILAGLKVADCFRPILGGDSMPVKKPDPGPFRRVLQEWEIAPADVLVVGDSPGDMEAGKKAGMLTCAVTYGFRPRKELEDARPNWLIDSMIQFKRYM